jgi:hypothetical protein
MKTTSKPRVHDCEMLKRISIPAYRVDRYSWIVLGISWNSGETSSVTQHGICFCTSTFALILQRVCDCGRGFDWRMDLLTIYTHDSELQAIRAPPLISTIPKSPQHPLCLFQSAVSSPAVPWQRLLTVEILQLQAFRSCLHSLPYRTQQITVSCL